jgi:hypothetical protein
VSEVRAGLDQDHASVAALGQPPRDDAPGGTATDDRDVETVGH